MTEPTPIVIPCADLVEALEFFVERLGFRLDLMSPADDPRRALLSGHGHSIELRRTGALPPAPSISTSPGTQEFIVSRLGDGSAWGTGRAGMRYRDLIPGRLDGRFIASHIRIDDGGPVPDYVHYHDIRFQMIYCVAGWVSVAYEDQGDALLLEAGDCFLQPPLIRHRVLECSPGLEVLEIACPAEHDTFSDHELQLPTGLLHPGRDFGGQRFVHHRADDAPWEVLSSSGFEVRDMGLGEATGGLAGARAWRVAGPASTPAPAPAPAPAPTATSAHNREHSWQHTGEFLFLYLLAGEMTLHGGEREPLLLAAGDSVVVPAGLDATARGCSGDLQLLEVRLPSAGS